MLKQNQISKGKDLKQPSISLDDFFLITVVGKGSYAKVVLVKKIDTGKIYAMKILKKKYIERKRQEEHVLTERNVLIQMDHPFIIKMSYSFQNERKLFFALEYCPGGELFNLLQKRKRFTEDQTKFYAAQIVLAIEYLHSKNIIYREFIRISLLMLSLKPENVLVDSEGYIKITDFGLSKMNIKNQRMAQSVCGTPEYLAPEILLKMGHGKPVDWWTLGAIIFEMLTGLPPFYTTNREELFQLIKFGTLVYPPYLSPAAKNLLEGLFHKNPDKRFGSQGAKQIKEHPWFSVVNWSALLNKQIKPPFLPIVRSEVDVSNFEMVDFTIDQLIYKEFTEQPIESLDQNSLSMASMNNIYPDFTYQENNKEQFEVIEQQQ